MPHSFYPPCFDHPTGMWRVQITELFIMHFLHFPATWCLQRAIILCSTLNGNLFMWETKFAASTCRVPYNYRVFKLLNLQASLHTVYMELLPLKLSDYLWDHSAPSSWLMHFPFTTQNCYTAITMHCASVQPSYYLLLQLEGNEHNSNVSEAISLWSRCSHP